MRTRDWREWKGAEQNHPNTRLMTQLPNFIGTQVRIFFDRKFETFWLEDCSINGPTSWYYWKLPVRRKR